MEHTTNYATIGKFNGAKMIAPPVTPQQFIPPNWPGTQDVDPLYDLRESCYSAAMTDNPLLDVWTPSAQECRTKLNKELWILGKNPCQRKTFKKTPVLWFN